MWMNAQTFHSVATRLPVGDARDSFDERHMKEQLQAVVTGSKRKIDIEMASAGQRSSGAPLKVDAVVFHHKTDLRSGDLALVGGPPPVDALEVRLSATGNKGKSKVQGARGHATELAKQQFESHQYEGCAAADDYAVYSLPEAMTSDAAGIGGVLQHALYDPGIS